MADVLAAARRIREYVHRTPVLSSRTLDEITGQHIYLKCENLQRAGAFKSRGAFNFLLQVTSEQRAAGVVTYSSGNHAQAVALAARELGIKATIVMPSDAPQTKLAATRGYGAEIILYDRTSGDREHIALDLAAKTGATVVPPFDHAWIVSGQGTAALELLEDVPQLEAIVTPLGGGGLFSGTILATDILKPGIPVFGVEPERANDWQVSMQAGERVNIGVPDTIADGLRTPSPGAIPFEIVRSHEGHVLTVSDEQMKCAMRFLLSRMKIVVEPSGAVGLAAALQKKLPSGLDHVGIILSGGNIDLPAVAAICTGEQVV